MPSETKLSAVLKEFAHTLLTDTPTQAILDHLVQRIVEILPVTSAGVTLIVPGATPEYVAASDPAAFRYERLQSELGDGPCLAAYRSGRTVAVPDLCSETRFPTFRAEALAAGLRAVFTFPLYSGGQRLGALDLYRETPGALTPASLDAARTLADVTSVYLINAKTRHEMQQLGRAQVDFVSNVSHSLRSPLTTVLGYVELLIDAVPGAQNAEQLRMLNIVQRNGQELLGLIENLLTMSREDSAGTELEIGPVDIGEVIDRVREATAPMVAKSGLELVVDLGSGTRIEGDGAQLERALLNLVSNAVKFTMPGGRIDIFTRARGDDIELSVRDTGTGIPIEEQHHLFTRFFRATGARERQVPGTGLGLYIVDHITKLHGGVMHVSSSPKGSTFTMMLPVAGPQAVRADPSRKAEPALAYASTV